MPERKIDLDDYHLSIFPKTKREAIFYETIFSCLRVEVIAYALFIWNTLDYFFYFSVTEYLEKDYFYD